MITLKVEEQYIDVYKGSIYCDLKEGKKKLCSFVFTQNTEYMYKGFPTQMDGVYNLKFKYFDNEGYMFRPVVNNRTMDWRYQNRKHPEPMQKNIIYLLIDKTKWAQMCKYLYSQNEAQIRFEGYNNRHYLEMIPEVFLQLEDEDDKLLDEWEEEEN